MVLGFGVNNTNVTLMRDNLEHIANSSNVPEFLVNINYYIYDGWLYIILLFIIWIIFFFIAQKNDDRTMLNLMNSGAIVSVLSLLMRGIYVTVSETLKVGLLTDSGLWIFPLITIVLSLINYSNR